MILTNKDTLESNSETPEEIIRSMMRREGDVLERNFLRYMDVRRDLYRDLNLNAIKFTQRRLIDIDKKTNSITVPCGFLKISSISIIDECEKIQTLIIDTDIKDDIVDVSLSKNCSCECGCNTDLCGVIKNYEAILEDVTEIMPDDSTKVFTKITRKVVYPDGSMFVKYTYPIRIYEEGAWTDTIDKVDEEFLCKLQVKKCGCIEDTEKNRETLGHCINADKIETDFGCTVRCLDDCNGNALRYNFSEEGNRIVFPSNFHYDKALLRFYVELKGKEIRIPLLAKPAFMHGLKAFALEFDDSVPKGVKDGYKNSYDAKKNLLALDLTKCSLKEVLHALIPHRRMP